MGKMKAIAADATTSDASVNDGQSPASLAEVALIIFGRDEAGRPHASRFEAGDADLAEKAADLMGFKALRVVSDEHRAAASKLPAGRIFATGRGFVPFCKEAAYEALSAFDGVFEPTAPIEPQPEAPPQVISVPQRWDDIAVGSLVLATTGEENCGWFEAIVAECRAEGVLILRWQGWPGEPDFLRAADCVALLPHAAAQP